MGAAGLERIEQLGDLVLIQLVLLGGGRRLLRCAKHQGLPPLMLLIALNTEHWLAILAELAATLAALAAVRMGPWKSDTYRRLFSIQLRLSHSLDWAPTSA